MQKIIDAIDRLLAEANRLKELNKIVRTQAQNDEYRQGRERWLCSIGDLLTFAGLKDHLERIQRIEADYSIDDARSTYSEQKAIPKIAGILESIRISITEGFVGKIKFLLHAEMFSSLVEQAEALLESGHKVPAAVLGRIIVERWVRDEAERARIAGSDSQRASVLNESLKKEGIFSPPKWRQVQAFLDIGNAAAHGKESEFTEHDVRRVLDFAKVNCV